MKPEPSLLVSPEKPVVFIVDDDISVRESLESLIGWAGWQPQAFDSAQSFLDQPRARVPCCLVLDISMPGLSGLELQRLIGDERADMPIIFVTGHGDIPMSVQAMKAGAVEFLTKPIDDEALLAAIRHALDRSRMAQVDVAETQVLQDRYSTLTPREREIMGLVVSGLLNKQVGMKLGISEITVKAHRGKMMQKMEADSLAELVRMSVTLHLTPARNPWHASRTQ